MTRIALCLSGLLMAGVVPGLAYGAADPVRIGITTILSGPTADRGQSEQYGAQIALDAINQAGGVLGRPVVAFYGDNACKPEVGVPATKRLIEDQHVPVLIGALCTPVTHAIEPLVAQDKVPLVIATSAGQDFVDASGVGGNDYLFKTIPSEVDVARGLIAFLKGQGIHKVAVVTDADGFFGVNGTAMASVAEAEGLTVTQKATVPKGTTDLAPLVAELKAGGPDAVLAMFGPSTAPFFHAYEASGWNVPVSGRIDLAGAARALSPAFKDEGGLARLTSATLFTTAADLPGVQRFVAEYQARYGLVPTQRSFYVYEAVRWVADAIRRAGTDTPAAIEAALKTSDMPSELGSAYKLDDHNHPRMPIFIMGLRDGKPAVVATE